MLRKIWTIVLQQLYIVYTDRALLLIMLATPLALATIIGLALPRGSTDVAIRDIPIVIVNQDTGRLGQVYVELFIPPEERADATPAPDSTVMPDATAALDATPAATADDSFSLPSCGASTVASADASATSLYDLTAAAQMDDPAAARAGVDAGTYVAAILIPPDFSDSALVAAGRLTTTPTSVEVYVSEASPISAGIVRAVVEGITSQMATGAAALNSSINAMVLELQQNALLYATVLFNSTGGDNTAFSVLLCGFTPEYNVIRVETQTVTGNAVEFNPLVYFGAATSMFFMLFTGQQGAAAVLEDRRNGTLARLLSTPTSRLTILTGKLLGTFITCLVQIALLFFAFTVVGTLMNGELTLIWGDNLPGILLMMVASALSVAGLGVLMASLERDAEQVGILGSTFNIVMAVLGGAFFTVENIPALQPFTVLSMIFWGKDGFVKLSQGIPDVGLNALVLLVQGGVMFLIGLWVFNRKLDV